jgi:hypothetical protein
MQLDTFGQGLVLTNGIMGFLTSVNTASNLWDNDLVYLDQAHVLLTVAILLGICLLAICYKTTDTSEMMNHHLGGFNKK